MVKEAHVWRQNYFKTLFLLFYWVTPHKENRKLSQVSFHFFVDRLVLT